MNFTCTDFADSRSDHS